MWSTRASLSLLLTTILNTLIINGRHTLKRLDGNIIEKVVRFFSFQLIYVIFCTLFKIWWCLFLGFI